MRTVGGVQSRRSTTIISNSSRWDEFFRRRPREMGQQIDRYATLLAGEAARMYEAAPARNRLKSSRLGKRIKP
jgi:uncharacterized protein YceH (UPF0502 family)